MVVAADESVGLALLESFRRSITEAVAEMSHDDIRRAIQQTLDDMREGPGSPWPWARDVWDDVVVYEFDGKLYQAPYTISTEGAASLGDPVEVRVTYTPVSDSDQSGTTSPAPGASGGSETPGAPAPSEQATESKVDPVAIVRRVAADEAFRRQLGAVIEQVEADPDAYDADQLPLAEVSNLGTLIEVSEGALRNDGSALVKLIQPGWGSSGYYSEEMLRRDGAKAFDEGTQMFWNHATDAEEESRPEGDLHNLAAVLTEDARWLAEGPKGPGLYANAKTLPPFRDTLDEIAPHIGVSIRGLAHASEGEAEGREGWIIDELVEGRSVDFVTVAGAGGEVVSLYEAAGRKAREQKGARTMPEETTTKVAEVEAERDQAKADLRKARETVAIGAARTRVTEALAESKLPDITKQRLIEQLPAKATIGEDGELDTEKFDAVVTEAVKAEADYLAKLTGSGEVKGFGESESDQDADTEKQEKAEGRISEAMKGLGISEDAAKAGARGRR